MKNSSKKVKKLYLKTQHLYVGTPTEVDIEAALYDDAPAFIGELRDDLEGGIKIWCPHCKEWHYHDPVEGLMDAHCIRGPLHGKQYVIVLPQSECDKFPEIYNDTKRNREVKKIHEHIWGSAKH